MELDERQFFDFLKSSRQKPQDVTNKMLDDGYPMPEFCDFLNLTIPKEKEWKCVIRYLRINNNIIKKQFNEIINKRVCNSGCTYNNGCIIDKTKNGYIFRSFTIVDSICLINHTSFHSNKNYGLKSGFTNTFRDDPMIAHDVFDYYGDGSDYINEYLEEMINRAKNNNNTYWDVIS